MTRDEVVKAIDEACLDEVKAIFAQSRKNALGESMKDALDQFDEGVEKLLCFRDGAIERVKRLALGNEP